jgi:hypothetical protein
MKTINVESPTHFWSLIKSREEIFEDNQSLKKFIYITEMYIKGCNCGGTDKKELMDNQYRIISKDVEIYELLKREFECEEIIFNDINPINVW